MYAPPLLSRILLAVSAIIALGVCFVFVSRALQPAQIQIPAMPRQAEKFNPKADLSSNQVFSGLSGIFVSDVPDLPMGRSNPFLEYAEVAAPEVNTEDMAGTSTTTTTATTSEITLETVTSSEPATYE